MIVYTMTYKEIYDNLAKEKTKVEYAEQKLLPKALKALRKSRTLPAWQIYEYKIPSTNNRYLITYYANNLQTLAHPIVNTCLILYFGRERALVRWFAGGYQHTLNRPIEFIRQLHIFRSHFFLRYNERLLKQSSISSDEAACIFFARNHEIMPIKQNAAINRNFEKYGPNGQDMLRVHDGVCCLSSYVQGLLSEDNVRENDQIESMALVYNTYLSGELLHEGQCEAVDKECTESWNRFYEQWMKQSKGTGRITFQLLP